MTVLEASAGTGKTYTIAALAARYVAEGIPLERLLLVTFTRMATGELRERVRERLIEVERGLAAALAGAPAGDDPVVDAAGVRRTSSARRERLARAVAGFDAATIATTHGFCQEVLGGLGIAGDLEPDVTFVEDLSDLAAEVIDDLYVRKFRRGDPPAFTLAQAAEIARAAIDNPSAELVAADGGVPEMRAGLARAARDGARAPQARDGGDDLRRPGDPAADGAARPGGRGGPGGAALALRRRARRRVPGHRPGAVGDHARGVRVRSGSDHAERWC